VDGGRVVSGTQLRGHLLVKWAGVHLGGIYVRGVSHPLSRVIQLASSTLRTISKAYSDMLKSLVIDFKLTYAKTLIV
jgi:hypothetical protein